MMSVADEMECMVLVNPECTKVLNLTVLNLTEFNGLKAASSCTK